MKAEVKKLNNKASTTTENYVAILDAGAQYGMDIEQQVKKLGFNAKRLPFETPVKKLEAASAIILSGGPESVYDKSAPKFDLKILESGKPILGICYGAQLINYSLGGAVKSLSKREDGFTDITVSKSIIFSGLGKKQTVLMSHGDTVTKLAAGFEVKARSGNLIAAIENNKSKIYGLQFHPEVSTEHGPEMLKNFLNKVSGLKPGYKYTTGEFINDVVNEVKEFAGNKQVLAFVSGGVDSSALAALLSHALPKIQISLVYVDHGFMRLGESEYVAKMLAKTGIKLNVFDASKIFANATTIVNGKKTQPLNKTVDPEIKRKIIGDTFIKVQDHMAETLGLDTNKFILAMGTLHTDLIESGSSHASNKADTIKSHHNDTEAVRKLREQGRVLEPWKLLQKDDVRKVAKELGLPAEIHNRQPFPGPGLAIRIICTQEPAFPDNKSAILRKLKKFETSAIKTTLLPIKSVGVQGDHRTYGNVVALSGKPDWGQLTKIARDLPREVHEVNRVVYLFKDSVGNNISKVTPTLLNAKSVDKLKVADDLVNSVLVKHGLDKNISQVPVILLPFGKSSGGHSIAIRTFMTTNFKTGDFAMPGRDIPKIVLDEIVKLLLKLGGISYVLYDLTSKPPATTEWE